MIDPSCVPLGKSLDQAKIQLTYRMGIMPHHSEGEDTEVMEKKVGCPQDAVESRDNSPPEQACLPGSPLHPSPWQSSGHTVDTQ